jgi:hypothetical protein
MILTVILILMLLVAVAGSRIITLKRTIKLLETRPEPVPDPTPKPEPVPEPALVRVHPRRYRSRY